MRDCVDKTVCNCLLFFDVSFIVSFCCVFLMCLLMCLFVVSSCCVYLLCLFVVSICCVFLWCILYIYSCVLHLCLSPVILSCLVLNSHGPRVMSLISTIMSLRKVVLRRDIIVENKDINLAPWLFHSVQHFFIWNVNIFCT